MQFWFFELGIMAGGFGFHVLGMSRKIYEQSGIGNPGNTTDNIKDPSLSWIIVFLFTVSFLGPLAVVPLRKVKKFGIVRMSVVLI